MDPELIEFDNKNWDLTLIRELLTETYDLVENKVLEKFLRLNLSQHLPNSSSNADKARTIVTHVKSGEGPGGLYNLLDIVQQEPSCKHVYQQHFVKAQNLPIEHKQGQSSMDVYLVIAAMNKKQAKAVLRDGEVNDISLFHQFKQAYREEEVTHWLHNYGRDASEWKPFGEIRINNEDELTDRKTVVQLFDDLTEAVNDWRAKYGFPLINMKPTTICLDFDNIRTQEKELENKHYVLVIDSVSLFHPNIWRKLSTSALTKPPVGSAVLVVNPTTSSFLQLNHLLLNGLELRNMYTEHVDYLSPFCEIGVKNRWDIRRWLFMALSFSGKEGAKFPSNVIKKKAQRFFEKDQPGIARRPTSHDSQSPSMSEFIEGQVN